MAEASSSNDLKQILELMQKREREHAAEMQELRNAFEDLKENMAHGGANSRNVHGPFQVRNVKLDFPRFDGSDVLQWIFKAEQFFDYYDTPDEQRLTIAAIHFEKEVVPWYQMMQRNNPIVSWNTLVRSLELEFGPSPFESPRSTLFKLTQSTSVNEYYVQFTALANKIYGVSNEALLDCFISGLKTDIRREKCNHAGKKGCVIHAMRGLSPAEMQSHREKGLCYTCDERLTANHKCPNRQYTFLQVEYDEEEQTDTEIPALEQNLEHHLSLNALKGVTGVGTMRFQGSLQGLTIQILLDSGSSDNFLQPRIAHCLKLPVEDMFSLQVLVGNGNAMSTEGVIKEIQVKVQGHTLKLPVYLLPVFGADLILGAAWLATIGPHIADYRSLSLKFYSDKQLITLQGEPPTLPKPAELHQMTRLCKTDAIAELFTLQLTQPLTLEDDGLVILENIDPDIALLLHTYNMIFAKPKGLPPNRSQNHCIPLLPDVNAVRVRPYKYPHSQKQQIENMVQQMLDEGIITHSTSPFSCPIILVKKKDGTWRFCTDYRALNAVTIKDKFPIPTVEELLDELFGAKFFSKLDLKSGYHQILVHPADRFKTAFRTHQGHYSHYNIKFLI
ncbi:uncharacterized protein LOC108319747 [Vigna angularis]|uniref:uncharacterized protein LOC108319747 n=1 Tax=Phaseolus angularis TaxID=3914 RepID=UPI000809DDB3|nr:uncharacterized protein LOC108319747 [Vigna angularis]